MTFASFLVAELAVLGRPVLDLNCVPVGGRLDGYGAVSTLPRERKPLSEAAVCRGIVS